MLNLVANEPIGEEVPLVAANLVERQAVAVNARLSRFLLQFETVSYPACSTDIKGNDLQMHGSPAVERCRTVEKPRKVAYRHRAWFQACQLLGDDNRVLPAAETCYTDDLIATGLVGEAEQTGWPDLCFAKGISGQNATRPANRQYRGYGKLPFLARAFFHQERLFYLPNIRNCH